MLVRRLETELQRPRVERMGGKLDRVFRSVALVGEKDVPSVKATYYLTFDGSCFTCSTLAAAIEDEAGGKLSAISNGSEQARTLLRRALPQGYERQPYLIAVKGEAVSAASGLKMAVRLGRLLGPRKGVRVYNMALQLGVTFRMNKGAVSIEKGGVGRADFLKQGALFAGAFVALPGISRKEVIGLLHANGSKGSLSSQLLPTGQVAQAVATATGSGDGQLLIEHFKGIGHTPLFDQAAGQAVVYTNGPDTTNARVLSLPLAAQGNRQAVFKHVTYGDGAVVLMGVIVATVNGGVLSRLEGYEVKSGQVIKTGEEDNPAVPLTPLVGTGSVHQSGVQPQTEPQTQPQRRSATVTCNICAFLVRTIEAAGCGIFAFAACEAACGGLGGVVGLAACSPLCTILVGAVCGSLRGQSDFYDCTKLGFC